MGSITKAVGRSVLIQYVITVIITIVLLLIIINLPWQEKSLLSFDNQVNLVAFVTLPTLVIAVIQLRNNIAIQKATLVKDFATKLYSDKELSQSYHYLIYSYTNENFKRFKQASEADREKMQGSREEGNRLYDPDDKKNFICSEEERKLDNLLGYFDIIGYHYWLGAIEMKDIARTLGTHLTYISQRDVIKEYLNDLPDYWTTFNKVKSKPEAVAPLRYLTFLLNEFKVFNENEQKKLQRISNIKLLD